MKNSLDTQTTFKSARMATAHSLAKHITTTYGGNYRVNLSLIMKEMAKVHGMDFVNFVKEVYEAPIEQEEIIVESKEQYEGLTVMETELMNGMVTNDYSNALLEFEEGQKNSEWTFAIIGETSFTGKQAKGVISSLIKKGMIFQDGKGNDSVLGLTVKGYELLKSSYKA